MRPEGALALKVHLVGPEEWRLLQTRQDRRYFGVESLELLDGGAGPEEVPLGDLRSAFEGSERARELLWEEVSAVEDNEHAREETHS